MDFLASYGGDSDEDVPVREEIISTSVQKTQFNAGNNNAGNSNAQPKTKKLDVSILPLAIQNALLRGDNMDDSDSDDDSRKNVKNQDIDASENKSAMTKLLGSLPKPKNSFSTSKVTQLSSSSITNKTSNFVHSYDTTTVTANSKEKNSYESEVTASINDNPVSVFTLPVAKSNVNDVMNSAYQFDINPTFQYSNDYIQSNTTMHMNNDAYDDADDTNVSNKRRKRDLEKSLLSGDTSIIEGNGKIIDVNGMNADWNKQSYVDQQSFKKQILSKYNISDGNGISKSQSRTHHINSLVAKAAQTEIKIMEKSLR